MYPGAEVEMLRFAQHDGVPSLSVTAISNPIFHAFALTRANM